jgi:hypothetical protein
MSDATNVQAPAADAPTIGLVDIQNAVKVIDHAADQGAFKGWAVIEQVAQVRQKLNAFVEHAAALQEAEKAAAEAAAPAADEAAPAKKTTKTKAKATK